MKTHILCSIDTEKGTRLTGIIGAFKDTKGKANPKIVNELIKSKLEALK